MAWRRESIPVGLTPIQQQYLHDSTRFLINTAGRRARKTFLSLNRDIIYAIDNPRSVIFLLAPTLKQARRIFWERLKNICSIGLARSVSETEHQIILANGTRIIVEGLDKPERIEGNMRVDYIHVTETADVKPSFLYEHLLPTLADTNGRGIFEGTPDFRRPHYRQLITNLIGSTPEKPEPYKGIRRYSENAEWAWYSWQSVDVLGSKLDAFRDIYDEQIFRQEFEAEFIESSNRAYYQFSEENIVNTEFSEKRRTVLSFDFNVDPMTCLVIQEFEPDRWAVVHEFVLRNSNTHNTCETVLRWLQEREFKGTLEATGDYTGRALRSSSAGYSDWRIIESYFHIYRGYRTRIRNVTGHLRDSINATNALFCNARGRKHLLVNKNCKILINDLQQQVYRDDGTLNDEGGQIGHRSDALRYFAYNYYPIRAGGEDER